MGAPAARGIPTGTRRAGVRCGSRTGAPLESTRVLVVGPAELASVAATADGLLRAAGFAVQVAGDRAGRRGADVSWADAVLVLHGEATERSATTLLAAERAAATRKPVVWVDAVEVARWPRLPAWVQFPLRMSARARADAPAVPDLSPMRLISALAHDWMWLDGERERARIVAEWPTRPVWWRAEAPPRTLDEALAAQDSRAYDDVHRRASDAARRAMDRELVRLADKPAVIAYVRRLLNEYRRARRPE